MELTRLMGSDGDAVSQLTARRPCPVVGLVGMDPLHGPFTAALKAKLTQHDQLHVVTINDIIAQITKKKDRHVNSENYIPCGILKRDWVAKHQSRVYGCVIIFFDVNSQIFRDRAHFDTTVATFVDKVRTRLRGRSTRLLLVLVKDPKSNPVQPSPAELGSPSSSGDGAAPELHPQHGLLEGFVPNAYMAVDDALNGMRKKCDLEYRSVASISDVSELPTSIQRMHNQLLDLVSTYHKQEIARLKKLKGSAPKGPLFVRHRFKIAWHYEIIHEYSFMRKYATQAHEALVALNEPHSLEILACSAVLQYKIAASNVMSGDLRQMVSTFLWHMRSYTAAVERASPTCSAVHTPVMLEEMTATASIAAKLIALWYVAEQYAWFAGMFQEKLQQKAGGAGGRDSASPITSPRSTNPFAEPELQPEYYLHACSRYFMRCRQRLVQIPYVPEVVVSREAVGPVPTHPLVFLGQECVNPIEDPASKLAKVVNVRELSNRIWCTTNEALRLYNERGQQNTGVALFVDQVEHYLFTGSIKEADELLDTVLSRHNLTKWPPLVAQVLEMKVFAAVQRGNFHQVVAGALFYSTCKAVPQSVRALVMTELSRFCGSAVEGAYANPRASIGLHGHRCRFLRHLASLNPLADDPKSAPLLIELPGTTSILTCRVHFTKPFVVFKRQHAHLHVTLSTTGGSPIVVRDVDVLVYLRRQSAADAVSTPLECRSELTQRIQGEVHLLPQVPVKREFELPLSVEGVYEVRHVTMKFGQSVRFVVNCLSARSQTDLVVASVTRTPENMSFGSQNSHNQQVPPPVRHGDPMDNLSFGTLLNRSIVDVFQNAQLPQELCNSSIAPYDWSSFCEQPAQNLRDFNYRVHVREESDRALDVVGGVHDRHCIKAIRPKPRLLVHVTHPVPALEAEEFELVVEVVSVGDIVHNGVATIACQSGDVIRWDSTADEWKESNDTTSVLASTKVPELEAGLPPQKNLIGDGTNRSLGATVGSTRGARGADSRSSATDTPKLAFQPAPGTSFRWVLRLKSVRAGRHSLPISIRYDSDICTGLVATASASLHVCHPLIVSYSLATASKWTTGSGTLSFTPSTRKLNYMLGSELHNTRVSSTKKLDDSFVTPARIDSKAGSMTEGILAGSTTIREGSMQPEPAQLYEPVLIQVPEENGSMRNVAFPLGQPFLVKAIVTNSMPFTLKIDKVAIAPNDDNGIRLRHRPPAFDGVFPCLLDEDEEFEVDYILEAGERALGSQRQGTPLGCILVSASRASDGDKHSGITKNRANEQGSSPSSPRSLSFEQMLPAVKFQRVPVDAMLEYAATAVVGETFELCLTLGNTTNNPVAISVVTADASSPAGFALTGRAQWADTLLAQASRKLLYQLLPLRSGNQLLPSFSVSVLDVDGKTTSVVVLDKDDQRQIFVRPGRSAAAEC